MDTPIHSVASDHLAERCMVRLKEERDCVRDLLAKSHRVIKAENRFTPAGEDYKLKTA